MTDEPTIHEDDRDDLVAYLDGELDEARSRELEHTLADSAVARQEVHELQRSFDLLDLLPLERASSEFTARTMSSIAVDGDETVDEQPVVDWSGRTRRGAIVAGWIAALSLAAIGGFLLTNRWVGTEGDQLVRDLPVVENLDAYTEAGSLTFLAKLRDSRVLEDFEGVDEN